MAEQQKDIFESFTEKERKFCIYYSQSLNGSKAAREAGYSENTCAEIAYENLRKPHIKAALKVLLEEDLMSVEEATKRLSAVASTRLNDYLVVKQVMRTPTVKKPLDELISELQTEIEFEEEYIRLAEDPSEEEEKRHEKEQRHRRRQILRYRLELKRNPDAFRYVDGTPVMVEQADVDLVALAKDDIKGTIKSISFGEYGPKVELYSAESAIKTILEVHGKIIARHEVTGKNGKDLIPAMLDKLSPEQLEQFQKLQQQVLSE